MDAARKESSPDAPVALIVLTIIVYVAGFAMFAAWFVLLLLERPGPPAPSRGATSCSVCGVVERVVESERGGLQLSGDQGESIVMLLATLGGMKADAPGRMYETAVLHDDGSVRIVRDANTPQWKQGDRVKVVKGRVETIALGRTDKF